MSDRHVTDTLDEVERGHHVFVPAVMSVGVLFSLTTLVRDAITRSERQSIHRRATLDGGAVADGLLAGRASSRRLHDAGVRRAAVLVGVPLTAVAVYLVPGSVLNYLREDGYVSNIAWLLALSSGVAAASALTGGLLLVLALRWPEPPVATRGAARVLVGLGVARDGPGGLTGWHVTAVATSVATVAAMLAVSTSSSVRRADELLADAVQDAWPASLHVFDDLYGRTEVAVLLAIVIGVSTLRCRPFAVTYVAAVGIAIGLSNVIRLMIDRDRPPLSAVEDGSFPSGHLIQAVLFVGLVPLALRVLGARPRTVRAVGAALVAATAITGVQRIADGNHWPSDVVAGVAIGLLVVAVARVVLQRAGLHDRCRGCPWSPGSQP